MSVPAVSELLDSLLTRETSFFPFPPYPLRIKCLELVAFIQGAALVVGLGACLAHQVHSFGSGPGVGPAAGAPLLLLFVVIAQALLLSFASVVMSMNRW